MGLLTLPIDDSRREGFKEAKTKGLCGGGIVTVKDDGCAAKLSPVRVAAWKEISPSLGELRAGVGFDVLELPGNREISELDCVGKPCKHSV